MVPGVISRLEVCHALPRSPARSLLPPDSGRVALARTSGPAPCPPSETITVNPPTAAAPTTVTVSVTPPLNLRPASEGDQTSFHLHYFVDLDPTTVLEAGKPIPRGDPQIIHSAATTLDLGALAPGKHTVWVVPAQVNHVPCSPNVRGQVTFTIGATSAPASAGVASSTTISAGLCQPGDSRCSYCSDHPESDLCKQYPPAKARAAEGH